MRFTSGMIHYLPARIFTFGNSASHYGLLCTGRASKWHFILEAFVSSNAKSMKELSFETPYLPYVTWKFDTIAVASIESFNPAHFAFCSPPEGE
ncbi:hypothetical protein DTO217A2_4656 [Paecilomyces variotii]|nr:hypothetical protein DTO217A2_4656 [Paecilomyces variotii]